MTFGKYGYKTISRKHDFDGEPKKEDEGGAGAGAGSEKKDETAKTPEEIKAELEKEYEKKLQSEADKRVTEALKKAKAKWDEEKAEAERVAKLSADEKAKEETEKRLLEQAEKERALAVKEMKLELVDVLVEQGMDLGFKELINVEGFVGIEDAKERSKAIVEQVKSVKGIFDALVDKKVEDVKKEFLKGQTPDKVGGKGNTAPADAYEEAKKAGNVKEMIRLKLEQLNKAE